MKILFTGGGTGGHTMPIIAISRELMRLYQQNDLSLYYIGPKEDSALLSQETFTTYSIVAGKIRSYFSLLNIIDILFKIPFSFLQAFFLLLYIRPKLIFSKGGTGSLPVTFFARIFRIPVFIHESDVAPGLSNRVTSKWAHKTFVSFKRTEYFNPQKTTIAGNPIRKELLMGNREEVKNMFDVNSEKPVVLVLGGSQGSQPLNDFILSIINSLLERYEVIHVVGERNFKRVHIESKMLIANEDLAKYYHVYSFLNEVKLKNAYYAANAVVSRAGSGSIFEIAAIGKPSILIPLPSSANDHQSKNAYQYARSGAAIIIEQESLSPNFFIGQISHAISQSKQMKEAALKFAKPDAAEKIAYEIINYLGHENQKTRA